MEVQIDIGVRGGRAACADRAGWKQKANFRRFLRTRINVCNNTGSLQLNSDTTSTRNRLDDEFN